MGVLSELEPKRVFYYFEQICRIPHGSGNVGRISDYLAAFAKEQGLYCVQDAQKNIIIIKEATEGYEKEPAVILQGHMDMVAVKKPESSRNLLEEGVEPVVEQDMIRAKDSSLGGDDGIAVAYCMALLEAKDIPHPRLEVVLTVDEETGMHGARMLDVSMLQGKCMINLDSEEEGIFLSGCAGGARISCTLPLRREQVSGTVCRLKLDGLQGGHSGAEIDKERGNANVLMGRVLFRISSKFPVRLIEMEGGLADNAIPRLAEMEVLLPEECGAAAQGTEAGLSATAATGEQKEKTGVGEREGLTGLLEELDRELQEEWKMRDPGIQLTWKYEEGTSAKEAVTAEDTRRAAEFVIAMPAGVQAMSPAVKGLVETSLNMGICRTDEEGITAVFAVRSSVESQKRYLLSRVEAIVGLAGGHAEQSGDYPGWQYLPVSPLRDKMIRIYEQMYGKKPEVAAIHAGVECGFMVDKIPGLDCISIGPDMKDIHTTEEQLSISSTARVWEYLLRVLAEKK